MFIVPYYALPGHIFSTYAKHEEPNSLIFTGTLRCSVCKKKKLSQCSVKVRGWNDLAKYLLEFHTNSVQQMEHRKKPSGSRCTTCNSNSHCLFPIEAAILGPQFNPSAYKQEKYNLPTLDMENLDAIIKNFHLNKLSTNFPVISVPSNKVPSYISLHPLTLVKFINQKKRCASFDNETIMPPAKKLLLAHKNEEGTTTDDEEYMENDIQVCFCLYFIFV